MHFTVFLGIACKRNVSTVYPFISGFYWMYCMCNNIYFDYKQNITPCFASALSSLVTFVSKFEHLPHLILNRTFKGKERLFTLRLSKYIHPHLVFDDKKTFAEWSVMTITRLTGNKNFTTRTITRYQFLFTS